MQIMLVSGTDQNALIRNLVEQRIEIMNAFFNGTLLEKDAAAALSKVESGRLLHEDLQAFHDYFQTDIEVVASYHVSVPKVTYRDEDVITALVRVRLDHFGRAYRGKRTSFTGNDLILQCDCRKSRKIL